MDRLKDMVCMELMIDREERIDNQWIDRLIIAE